MLATEWLRDVRCNWEELQNIVKSNDKQRFQLTDESGESLIRAVQGHSIKTVQDKEFLRRLRVDDQDLPAVCVHGTYHRHFSSIQTNGLRAGGVQGDRNHVHFAAYYPGDTCLITGMNHNAEVAVYVDLPRAIRANVPFYVSANKVILSPGVNGVIDAQYFLKAIDLQSQRDLLI